MYNNVYIEIHFDYILSIIYLAKELSEVLA